MVEKQLVDDLQSLRRNFGSNSDKIRQNLAEKGWLVHRKTIAAQLTDAKYGPFRFSISIGRTETQSASYFSIIAHLLTPTREIAGKHCHYFIIISDNDQLVEISDAAERMTKNQSFFTEKQLVDFVHEVREKIDSL